MVSSAARATTWLPSGDEVEFYRAHGWYVSRPVVPHALLDELRSVIERHQLRPAAQRLPASVGHADWDPAHGNGVRNSEFLSVQEPAMRALSLLPEIGAIAGCLAGTDGIRLFDDQAVVKPPQSSDAVVGWHTDHSYWSTCTSTEMLTAWVPFHDTNGANGTLMVVDGSHRWPESEHLRGFNDADLADLGSRFGTRVPEPTIVPLELRKGQVSFHHMRLIHGSGPNRSDESRAAVAVHLQPADNDYRAFTAGDGRRIVLPHDRLARARSDGSPDYADPHIFPTAWVQARG